MTDGEKFKLGVSADEILAAESGKETETQPSETYCFVYTKAELDEIYRLQRSVFLRKAISFVLICVLLILVLIETSAPDVMIGGAFGVVFIGLVSHIKGICAYGKAWKSSAERICRSTYEYRIFEDYLEVNIYRENEAVRYSKCYFKDVEKIRQFEKWLLVQFGGQTFIVRKSDLKEHSTFYACMYQLAAKTGENAIPADWRIVSKVLFVASLVSLLCGLLLVKTMTSINGLFLENMWLFYVLTPIPIASIVFGFMLKAKGYPYKKNLIAGFIMLFLLCVYGSFTFMFSGV